MATWSITPNTASIDNNGLANIPNNTGDSPITYTVTYNDGNGGSGQGTYVVNPCPTTCSCSNVNITNTSLNVGSNSGSSQIGVVTDNNCSPYVTYTSTASSWLTGETTSSNNIRIKYSENTSTDSRSGTVTIKMNDNTCNTCSVTQSGATSPTKGCTKMFNVDGNYSILMLYANDYVPSMPDVLYATNTDAENIDLELESIHADEYVGFRLEPDEFIYSRKIYSLKDNSGNVELVDENVTKHYGDVGDEFVLVYIESFRWDSTLNKWLINVATHDVYTPSFSDCGQ